MAAIYGPPDVLLTVVGMALALGAAWAGRAAWRTLRRWVA